MSEPFFSPQAVEDLGEILDYVGRDKPDFSLQFVERLKEECRMLARHPLMGVRRDELSPGLRGFAVGNYVNNYAPFDDGVRVECDLHGARDREAIFDDDLE